MDGPFVRVLYASNVEMRGYLHVHKLVNGLVKIKINKESFGTNMLRLGILMQ